MIQRISRLVWYIALVLSSALIVLTWYITISVSLAKNTIGSVDFLAYYAASYILRFETPNQLYDLALQTEVEQNIRASMQSEHPRLYPYNHPPIYLGLLYLIGSANYNLAYLRWLFFLISAHLLSIWLLQRWMRQQGIATEARATFILASFLFYPAYVAYMRGQDSTFLLLGATLWLYGLHTHKAHLTSLGLLIAMVRPQIALALLIPTLLHHHKTLLPWLFKWGAVFFVLNFPWIGLQGLRDYLDMLRYSGQGLDGYGFDVDLMATLMGAVLRAFPTMDVQIFQALKYGVYFFTLALLSWWWWRSDRLSAEKAGLLILATLLTSPHTHSHDHVLYLLPTFVLIIHLLQHRQIPATFAGIFTLMISILLAVPLFIQNTLVSVYVAALLLAYPLWQLSRRPSIPLTT